MFFFSQATDLIKLLPEGTSVIAVIIVVLLFLKQQREQSKQIESITSTFNVKIQEITTAFQSQVDRLANQIFQNERLQQEQVQKLFESIMQVSKEMISAILEIRGTVERLTQRMDKIAKGHP